MRSIIVLFMLALASPAFAQEDAGEAAYQAGRKAYDLREWDKAIANFKKAYEIRSDGPSLFNIAQSYRLKGDCGEALGFYKTYKRNFSTAPNIAAVDKFILEMETCVKEKGSQPKPPDTTTTTTPTDPTTTQTTPTTTTSAPAVEEPRVEDRGKGKRTAGIVIGGAGVALVGTGFLFGMIAKGKADDVTSGGDPSNPPEFDPSDAQDSGKRFNTFAKISWGVGGAAIVGGVVLFMLGKSAKETQVSAVPTQGGAMFAFGKSF